MRTVTLDNLVNLSLQCRHFPCVQELTVLGCDRVDLPPFCLMKSGRDRVGAEGGKKQDLL